MSIITPSPTPIRSLDLEAEGGPQLIGSRCTQCGVTLFPPVAACPNCLSDDPIPAALSREGRLYTYSVVHIAPKGWIAPYVIGYVDLPEEVRVFSHIAVDDPNQLQHDMRVRLDVGPIPTEVDGQPATGFRFVPA